MKVEHRYHNLLWVGEKWYGVKASFQEKALRFLCWFWILCQWPVDNYAIFFFPSLQNTELSGDSSVVKNELGIKTLATWWKELTRLKGPWCWERLRAGEEGDNRGWDRGIASLTQWTWIWVNSWSWWWTGRPGVLRSRESQRVGHNWVTELSWTESRTHENTLVYFKTVILSCLLLGGDLSWIFSMRTFQNFWR